jgi:uncharacterized protein (DUF1330 family)
MIEQPSFEAIPSGEFSPTKVASNAFDLYADIEDFFDDLDYQALFNTVLDHRQVDLLVAIRALDDVLGEIPVPYPSDDAGGDGIVDLTEVTDDKVTDFVTAVEQLLKAEGGE